MIDVKAYSDWESEEPRPPIRRTGCCRSHVRDCYFVMVGQSFSEAMGGKAEYMKQRFRQDRLLVSV